MPLRAAATLFRLRTLTLCTLLMTSGLASAVCSVNVVIAKGRVDHAPENAKVRVELVYAKHVHGEAAEATLEGGTFTVPVEFLTQSRRPVLVGSLLEKCERKPKTVIVTLVDNTGREFDRATLDFAKDFKMADLSAYAPRVPIVLDASR